jgi:AcrR family transcriptional regulator
MTGLRERKKLQTREAIIAAGEELFAHPGVAEATMEQIAERAAVSVGTLYNYFGSKTALLIAIFATEVEAMGRAGAEILAAPGDDLGRAVSDLFDAYLDVIFRLDRDLIREVITIGFESRGAVTQELVHMDEMLMTQLASLLTGRGVEVPQGFDVSDAVVLLYSALMTQLIIYVTLRGVSEDTTRTQVRRQVALAFAGIDTR